MKHYNAEIVQAARDSYISWQTRYHQALRTLQVYDGESVLIGSQDCALCDVCCGCDDCPVTHYDKACIKGDSAYHRLVLSGYRLEPDLLNIDCSSLQLLHNMVELMRNVWIYTYESAKGAGQRGE